jgi:uncharacterized membrane protein (DUF106 family)
MFVRNFGRVRGIKASAHGDEQSMTMDFVDGMIVTMIPSMLFVAWMVWRAPAI